MNKMFMICYFIVFIVILLMLVIQIHFFCYFYHNLVTKLVKSEILIITKLLSARYKKEYFYIMYYLEILKIV